MKRCFALVFVLFSLLHAAPGFALERAYNPWPSDGASGVSVNTDLAWDHSGKTVRLYFGTHPDRLYRLRNRSTSSSYYFRDSLRAGERYYWRVDVHDGDETARGRLWTFRTRYSTWGVVAGCNVSGQMNWFLIFSLPFVLLFPLNKR